MTSPNQQDVAAPADKQTEAAARAFCKAHGLAPDFFYDGRWEWQKVGFIDFDLRAAFEESERENARLATALSAANSELVMQAARAEQRAVKAEIARDLVLYDLKTESGKLCRELEQRSIDAEARATALEGEREADERRHAHELEVAHSHIIALEAQLARAREDEHNEIVKLIAMSALHGSPGICAFADDLVKSIRALSTPAYRREAGIRRPDWSDIYDGDLQQFIQPQYLVAITRHTAELAKAALAEVQAQDAYHNCAAAHRELNDCLVAPTSDLPTEARADDWFTAQIRSTVTQDRRPTLLSEVEWQAFKLNASEWLGRSDAAPSEARADEVKP